MGIPYAEVIGDPIAHSKSPVIHRFWLAKLGLEGDYRKIQVRREELADYLGDRRNDPDWRGCNVAQPHKQEIMRYLDNRDQASSRIGAANTVLRESGSLIGRNTDAPGFMEPLAPFLPETARPRLALLIGAGGAARSIAYALASAGFDLLVINRDAERARELTVAFGGAWREDLAIYDLAANRNLVLAEAGAPPGAALLVVNATSLGMAGCPPLEVELERVDRRAIVYDIVYSPVETPLLMEARTRGMRTIDGLAMLISQAAHAFTHFFGVRPPRQHDDLLRELLTR